MLEEPLGQVARVGAVAVGGVQGGQAASGSRPRILAPRVKNTSRLTSPSTSSTAAWSTRVTPVARIWSSALTASRIDPSDFWASMYRHSSSAVDGLARADGS